MEQRGFLSKYFGWMFICCRSSSPKEHGNLFRNINIDSDVSEIEDIKETKLTNNELEEIKQPKKKSHKKKKDLITAENIITQIKNHLKKRIKNNLRKN